MGIRQDLIDFSRGDGLRWFWRLYFLRKKTKNKFFKDALACLCSRSAHRHGGYVGAGAVLVGDIRNGHRVRIGAGAVIFMDLPDNGTAVSQAPRILIKDSKGDEANA